MGKYGSLESRKNKAERSDPKKMKSTIVATVIFALGLVVKAEDASKHEYFIAPSTGVYAHAGAIHISKQDIKQLPSISFPEHPLTTSVQDAAQKAISLFSKRFPNAAKPTILACELKRFPEYIANDKFYYLISITPVNAEEETTDGSILIIGSVYNVVIPVGSKSAYSPALSVKKMDNKSEQAMPRKP